MPAAVAAVYTFVATSVSLATLSWGAGTVAGIVAAGATIGATMWGLKKLSDMLAPELPAFGENEMGRLVTSSSTIEPQPIVYGQVRKGGLKVFHDVSGTNNEYYWMVVAVAGHEIDSFQKIHFSDKSDIDVATEIDGSGDVTNADYINSDSTKCVRIKLYTGTDTQTADSDLDTAFNTRWTSNHRGRGIAYAAIRLRIDDSEGGNDPDAPDANLWSKGIPDVTFTIRGKKIKDIRTSPHTTAWSDNPALCLRDYLTDTRLGMGEDEANIDDTVVAASANTCEESVTVWDGAGGSTTQERYTCNGIAMTSQAPAGIIQNLLSSCAGALGWTEGKFKIVAGEYDTPTQTIDESWLRGEVTVQASAPRRDRYNFVRGRFINPNRQDQLVEYEPRTSATYQTNDGGVKLEKSMDLPFTNDPYEAQRLALIALKKSRNQQTLELRCNLKAMQVALYEIVNVTIDELGYSSKPMRVINWKVAADGGVDLTLIEESSADWTFSYSTDLDEIVEPTESLSDAPETPPAPSGLVATSVAGGVSLEWTNPDPRFFDVVEVYRAATNNRPTSTTGRVTRTRGEQYVDPVGEGNTYYYWILTRNKRNNTSAWHPTGATSGVSGTGGATAVAPSYTTDNGLSWTRDASGVWSPSTTTTDITFKFDREGSTIATRTVRVTRAADGTLTAALQSSSGEATTQATVGSGTRVLEVQVTHTGSGLTHSAEARSVVMTGFTNLTPTQNSWVEPIADPMGGWDETDRASSECALMQTDEIGPYGSVAMLMSLRGTTVASNPGWFSQWRHYFDVDDSKSYISYCWVRRRSSDTTTGLYFGWTTTAGTIENVPVTSPQATTNPYWIGNLGAQLTVNDWYLSVGVIHPAGHAGGDLGVAGIYASDGTLTANGTEFRHQAGATTQFLRYGFFSNATSYDTTDGYDFIPAGTYEVNGAEPSIEQLLRRVVNQGNLATQDTVGSGDIDNGALDAADLFAATIRPVIVVGALPTLPNSDYPPGSTVVLTTDGVLYRNAGSPEAWVADVSASNLTQGTINTGLITVGSILQLGSGGKIYTTGKTSATDPDKGFFIGHDGSSNYDFGIGDSSESIVWDGSAGTLTVNGDIIATGNLQTGSVTTVKVGSDAITDRGLVEDALFDNTSTSTYQDTAAVIATADPCDADFALIFMNANGFYNGGGGSDRRIRLKMENVTDTITTYPHASQIQVSAAASTYFAETYQTALISTKQYRWTIQGWSENLNTDSSEEFTDVTISVVTFKR